MNCYINQLFDLVLLQILLTKNDLMIWLLLLNGLEHAQNIFVIL